MSSSHYNFNSTIPEIEAKIDTLLAKMTLDEKVGQTIQVHIHEDNRKEMLDRIKNGQVGSVLTIYGIDNINAVQKVAIKESRLGIPIIFGNDVIHGYRTIFPIPLAESCTWNLDLIEQSARIAAEEATANGVNWTFAPMVDICRDPRWGRIAEGAGEDPFLGEVIGAARVRGFQSVLSNGRKMVACPKHYAAYGGAEAGKDYNSVDMSERQLRDVYLPPFKAAFETGAGTTMSSFNEINGIPATANTLTLRQILREEWKFKGFVVSDWNSVGELIPHGVAADFKEAAKRAFLAGVDMDMTSNAYHNYLAELINEGHVPIERLNDSVRQILRIKFFLDLFEYPYTDPAGAEVALLKPEFLQTALEVTTQSMVLLKNQKNILPIDTSKIKNIALIGPLADDHHEILGTWHRIGRNEDTESVLDGLRQVLPDDLKLIFTQGCDLYGESPNNTVEAVTSARKADLAIMVLGETEDMSGEAHSRAHLGLPGEQQSMLEAVHATGTPVIVVLISGRPLVIPWIAENIPAILCAWHGGLRTGRAVADILFGNANPSGKLTASWPRAEGQIPVYYAHKMTGRPPDGEGGLQFQKYHFTEFIDEEVAPLFPFGFGLSYTKFTYSDLRVHTPAIGLDDIVEVSTLITNTGNVAGDEIVQLYVRDMVGEVTRPVKELKGFQKISLQPGESKTIKFQIPVYRLGFHGLNLQYKVEPGDFKVLVGPNSVEGLEGQFIVV